MAVTVPLPLLRRARLSSARAFDSVMIAAGRPWPLCR
jgi:hypothetical protein